MEFGSELQCFVAVVLRVRRKSVVASCLMPLSLESLETLKSRKSEVLRIFDAFKALRAQRHERHSWLMS